MRRTGSFTLCGLIAPVVAGLLGGCGSILPTEAAPLFAVPLAIEDEPIGTAVVDTGGGYEIMLSETFGLAVIDSVEVVAFAGMQMVGVTEAFTYSAGGVKSTARAAIIGESISSHNGLGFQFFRKTGMVLGIDFSDPTVVFVSQVPAGGITVDFHHAPPHLAGFDTSFIEVQVTEGGCSQALSALLDTGAQATMLRRSLVTAPLSHLLDRAVVTITNRDLGTVSVQVALFDNTHLPDVILGTDVMRLWGDRWYFSFEPLAGSVTVIRDQRASAASDESFW